MSHNESQNPACSGRPRRRWVFDGCALAIAVMAFAVSCRYTQTYIEGWDTVAYLFAAERIAGGGDAAICHSFNGEIGPYFTMAGFNVRSPVPDCLYLNYPLGYPVLLAAAATLVPIPGVMPYVPAFLGAVGLILTYLLGCMVASARVGIAAGILLALTPLYLRFSTSPWSDGPVAVLLLAGVVVFVWADRQLKATWQIAGGICAALFVGWAVFSRYSASVALVPVVAYALASRAFRTSLKSLPLRAFVATVAVCFVAIGIFNSIFYGGFFTTPYSTDHGWYSWPMFSLSYMFDHTPAGSASLLVFMGTLWESYGLLLLLGCLGWVALKGPARVLVLLELGCFTALYGLYAFPARGINARFLLPVLPFATLLIASGASHMWDIAGVTKWIVLALAFVAIAAKLIIPLPGTLEGLASRNRAAEAYVKGIQSMTAMAAPESVFLAYHANDAITYYGGRLSLFYRRIIPPPGSQESGTAYFESHLVSAVDGLLDRGVPVYYVLDTDPPLMGSMSVLSEHFSVVPSPLGTSVFRVERLGAR